MHEIEKIHEAKYFLRQMERPEEHFEYNLSAFLGAARSVLQFASKEAKTKPKGQDWYDGVAKNPIVKFFKDKRDINVHRELVNVREDLYATDSLRVTISDPGRVIIPGSKGNTARAVKKRREQEWHEAPVPAAANPVTAEMTWKYSFNDWTGNEDVPTLCTNYPAELEKALADGRAKGFLSRAYTAQVQ